jgi:hypothetical protein
MKTLLHNRIFMLVFMIEVSIKTNESFVMQIWLNLFSLRWLKMIEMMKSLVDITIV